MNSFKEIDKEELDYWSRELKRIKRMELLMRLILAVSIIGAMLTIGHVLAIMESQL